MEEESWGRNHGEGIWEASGRHLEAAGRHMGGIWDASEGHLGGLWGLVGILEPERPLGGKML